MVEHTADVEKVCENVGPIADSIEYTYTTYNKKVLLGCYGRSLWNLQKHTLSRIQIGHLLSCFRGCTHTFMRAVEGSDEFVIRGRTGIRMGSGVVIGTL